MKTVKEIVGGNKLEIHKVGNCINYRYNDNLVAQVWLEFISNINEINYCHIKFDTINNEPELVITYDSKNNGNLFGGTILHKVYKPELFKYWEDYSEFSLKC